MKPGLKVLAAAAIVLAFAMPAAATDINVTASTAACGNVPCLMATGNDTSQAAINAILAGLLPAGVSEVYKATPGVGDVDAAAAWYTTTFDSASDASGGSITWEGPGRIASPAYFLIKDGAQIPAWYLYDISNWDGLGTITFSGYWPTNGSISHIAIYGTTTTVPDGGSVAMLLGMALMGLAGARRWLK